MKKLSIEKIAEPNIYQINIDSKMKGEVANELFQFFQAKPADFKIRLLTIMKNFDGFKEFEEFIKGVSSLGLKITRLEKNAIISESRWIEKIIKFDENLGSVADFKFFKEKEKEEAIEWLKN